MNRNVRITDNIDKIREYQRQGIPCILVLNDKNSGLDTSCAKYCALLDEDITSEDKVREILGDAYLDLVEARALGKPLIISSSDRIIIRELTIDDAEAIYDLYENSNTHFLEDFYDSKEEARAIISRYINDVYNFYGYGLWAVTLRENEKVIGIVGFTPRDSSDEVMDIELGYAIHPDFQQKGYGLEAAMAAVNYAKENIEYGKILINVEKGNIQGERLGNKIQVLTTDVLFCSIDGAERD